MPSPNRKSRVVTGIADLVLTATADGGLPRPLIPPKLSILFRFIDGQVAGAGTVAFLDVPEIHPGTTLRARVVFPDAAPGEVYLDRRFELWLGHPVGSAVIVAVESDDTPSGTDTEPD